MTGIQCSNCHVNTAASFTTYTMGVPGHTSVSANRCDSCHNGSYTSEGTTGALGTASYSGHVATNGNDCITCHTSAATAFTSWSGGKYTHAATDTNCSNCHNGTTATGLATPPHIPVTGIQCSNCHVNTAASFVTYTMGTTGHASVSTSRCDSCHSGAYTSQGTTGALGTASFSGHVATNGNDCITCHTSATSAFTSWSGGKYTHAATDTNCSNCHNGTTATGLATPPHVPVTGIQCSNCHVNTAASFVTYTMGVTGHTSVSASRCNSCHNGSYTSQGTTGALGTASFSGHVATNGADCITCHTSAASAFTSWSGGKFTHATTDTNCSNCHNGTTATGLTTPPHIPVTAIQCSNCHTNTAASFTTYTMGVTGHTSVSTSRCELLPQRFVYEPGHHGGARHGVVLWPRRDQRRRLHHLSRQRGHGLHQLGGRSPRSRGHRHQLLELPQRHHRDWPDDATAHSGDGRSVQQLPRQYVGVLHDLYHGRDRPLVGLYQPLQLLSQRFLYQPGHDRRAGHGVVRWPCRNQWQRLHHLSRHRGHGLH